MGKNVESENKRIFPMICTKEKKGGKTGEEDWIDK